MGPALGIIEEIYEEKIALLKELLDCLARERGHLARADLAGLWKTMEDKQNLVASVEEKRSRMKRVLDDHGLKGSTLRRQPGLSEMSGRVAGLKQEIRARVRENNGFAQEMLDFLDELVSILLRGGKADGAYSPKAARRQASAALIYQREV